MLWLENCREKLQVDCTWSKKKKKKYFTGKLLYAWRISRQEQMCAIVGEFLQQEIKRKKMFSVIVCLDSSYYGEKSFHTARGTLWPTVSHFVFLSRPSGSSWPQFSLCIEQYCLSDLGPWLWQRCGSVRYPNYIFPPWHFQMLAAYLLSE